MKQKPTITGLTNELRCANEEARRYMAEITRMSKDLDAVTKELALVKHNLLHVERHYRVLFAILEQTYMGKTK